MTDSGPTFALAARSFGQTSETFVRDHARHLAPGRSVFVTARDVPPPGAEGATLARFQIWPRIIDRAGSRRLMLTLTRRRARKAVTRFLRDHGVGVLMAEFGPFGHKLLRATTKAGARHYVHFHGWDASRVLTDHAVLGKYEELWAHSSGFFAPSRFIADKLIGVGCPADRIEVTPCGVWPEAFPPSTREPGLCLAVGRLVEKKAPEITVQAFLAVAGKHPEARLEVIGDGPLMDHCTALVDEAGMADRVTFHGPQSHEVVAERMRAASVFLQHSVTAKNGDTEGLPVALLEAMCSGLTVVATRHSGIPEAVEDGRSGLLVDEHDGPGMAEALARVLDEPHLAEDLAAAARDRVIEAFTAEKSLSTLRQTMGL